MSKFYVAAVITVLSVMIATINILGGPAHFSTSVWGFQTAMFTGLATAGFLACLKFLVDKIVGKK